MISELHRGWVASCMHKEIMYFSSRVLHFTRSTMNHTARDITEQTYNLPEQ
jgi:hypothetical protein